MLIQKQKAISLLVQRLDSILLYSAEQKQHSLKEIHLELVLYQNSQSINASTQI